MIWRIVWTLMFAIVLLDLRQIASDFRHFAQHIYKKDGV